METTDRAARLIKTATVRYVRTGEYSVSVFLLWSSLRSIPGDQDSVAEVIRLVEVTLGPDLMDRLEMPKNAPVKVVYYLASAEHAPVQVLDAAKEASVLPDADVKRAVEFYLAEQGTTVRGVGVA